jgi:succinate-acetate transporter protein
MALTPFLALTCYGGFWFVCSPFVFPAFGLAEFYANHPDQSYNALAMILAGWTILTTIFLCVLCYQNVPFTPFFYVVLRP